MFKAALMAWQKRYDCRLKHAQHLWLQSKQHNLTTFCLFICETIKCNESYVGNIDFEMHPIIVFSSFTELSISLKPEVPF